MKARFFNAKLQRSKGAKFSLFLFFFVLIFIFFDNSKIKKTSAENVQSDIEKAIFTRQEFFGAEAIVSLPTSEARENLKKLAENLPDNSQILEKLAEAEEKLSQFGEAEKHLTRLAEIDAKKLENLAAFYKRRAEFSKQAEVLRKILFSDSTAENRVRTFEKLINLARIHDLKIYLQNDFYNELIKENPTFYGIFESLIETLCKEKNYAEALKFVRQAKMQFPEKTENLLEKEISILVETKQIEKAETVYREAFNPFWTDEEAQKFYDFLDEHNRLRAYGAEIKNRFRKNPSDFDAAMRLMQYQNHDYNYDNDEIAPIILRLEQAKKSWTTEELTTISRILLQKKEIETASRFLYTLFLREDFKQKSELRAPVLYQIFRIFVDAENRKLPLVKNNLRFYEDIAKADTNPGIATGILSLIFSDTNPRRKLSEQEAEATKFFNRAAAYRIFEEYKKEFPLSPELAQMYLDIVQIYTAEKDTEIAEKVLNEFAERFENSTDYADSAIKLAESFLTVKNNEKGHEFYQKAMDFLGKQNKPLTPKINFVNEISENNFTKNDAEIFYADVLKDYVESLAKEQKTAEILAFYEREIAKYENEEWLYEQRLSWLEKTNLTEAKLEIYKSALARFQNKNWRDKLARFFLREKRTKEFAAFSEDLTAKLNDAEIQSFLSEFMQGKISAADFDTNLKLKLYQSAHLRFPHNLFFVKGLLDLYKSNKSEEDWRKLATQYYFASPEIRENFLNHLAERGKLREYLAKADGENTIYELFRADVFVRLSNFENAVTAYRKLNALYPHETQFAERLINLTRSFGQKNREFLTEAAEISKSSADFFANSAESRTRSGELQAELGNFENANAEWEKMISLGTGTKEVFLETATVQWDYFQFADALGTIKKMREKFEDETLYAFETGAIYETQNQETQALSEYVKALGDSEQKERAAKRLAKLFDRESSENLLQKIDTAFENEKNLHKNFSELSLGYAEFLVKIKHSEKAEKVLNNAIRQSSNTGFLQAACEFYQMEKIVSGERFALQKLSETAKNPRQKIQFQLQLAESFTETNERIKAKNILAKLVREFPTNFGVITETSDFYWRLGFENESTEVLQNALLRSKGVYQNRISQKLSARLIRQNRFEKAEMILLELHSKNKTNTEIFRELSRVLVRTNKPDLLRKIFSETVAELKKSDADRREIEYEIAELRAPMIDAFTRLRDYRAAVEQHIEIINRDAETQDATENAIRYVQRYGGADVLLEYYKKLAAESFKNYRWNLVLARIYEANSDFENAVKNYQTAIINQPEMPELYLAIAEIETRRNNFNAAIENINEVLTLTNDAPEFVKKKIEILKKAGRFSEIETEKAKLPTETETKIETNEFAEAQKLQSEEREKSRRLFREGLAKLLENPLGNDFKASDISAFVKAVREEEPLNKIAGNLWDLREKLIKIADETDGKNAGEARKRLSILDGAFLDSVGEIAKNAGTDEELADLHQDWKNRSTQISFASDRHQTISLIQNLSRRAGFRDLEETILFKRLEETASSLDKQNYLQNLINFYNERGAFQKTFEALEKHGAENLPLKAEFARLSGECEKELGFLREIYWKNSDKNGAEVARYLEILYTENRDELKTLTERNSVYQLQLINFLLAKGERELVRNAIKNSVFSTAWKVSRSAETSLALREFDKSAECYFCEALQLDSIGNLINQTPDKRIFLINDDWFRLSRQYGEWLFEKKEISQAEKFLTAMTENLPQNADEQTKLGDFYFQKGNFEQAAEHFHLANELKENDAAILANLGAAFYKKGNFENAENFWAQSLADESLESSLEFFQTLQEKDLAPQAREKILPILVDFLKIANAEDSETFQELIRAVASSFENEAEKAAYFRNILQQRPTDKSLAEMLISENLIEKAAQNEFYELLSARSEGLSYETDYNFQSVAARVFSEKDAESVYDHENNYEIEETENEKLEWQKKYLSLLIEQGENVRAKQLISEIENNLKGRFARPVWFRLAKIQIGLRDGKFDLEDAEMIIGIRVSDSATEIKPPNLERFNEVLKILRLENREDLAVKLSESFFARNLAIGQINSANFVGLARTFFQTGKNEKGLRILRLMIDSSVNEKRETALAEIASFDEIKMRTADAAKLSETETESDFSHADALKIAAEIAAEFGQKSSAIAFRRELFERNQSDFSNKIELAKLLAPGDESEKLLLEIIENRDAGRNFRWQARIISGKEIPNVNFDSYSQFSNGIFALENDEKESAINFFISSLIADKDAQNIAKVELIKLYMLTGKPFAALKLAESLKETKSDELLQILSETAETIGDFQKAIEFEKEKSDGGNAENIGRLQKLSDEKNKRAADYTIDKENTRKL